MILEPPAQYDYLYPGPLTEFIWVAPKVDAYCREAGVKGDGQIIGCQFKIGDRCFIVLSKHAINPIRRHEMAHCNGWMHP